MSGSRLRRGPGGALALAALLAAGCGTSAAPPEAPVVVAFSAMPPAIAPGGASVLAWEVTGADSVRLEPQPGTVRGTSLLVSPAVTTVYTLVATNAGGEVRSGPVTVSVTTSVGPPDDPPELRVRGTSGGGVALSWGFAPFSSGYVVARRAAYESTFIEVATLDGTRNAWVDGSVVPNQLCFYRVSAVNGAGASPGAQASALPPPPPPEGPVLTVSPAAAVLDPGGELLFTSSGPATWSVLEGRAGGTITSAGRYQAPAGSGTWHVVADGGVAALASITVR